MANDKIEYKIGQWYEGIDGDKIDRLLCVFVNRETGIPVFVRRTPAVERIVAARYCEIRRLPGCDGWDWQPQSASTQEKLPDPGEGWRLIDPAVDTPQVGDQMWGSDKEWIPRERYGNELRPFGDTMFYRRRVTDDIQIGDFVLHPLNMFNDVGRVSGLVADGTAFIKCKYGKLRIKRNELVKVRYEPFTLETFVPHRNRWLKHKSFPSIRKATSLTEHGTDISSYRAMLDNFVFDDDKTPCGTPVPADGRKLKQ